MDILYVNSNNKQIDLGKDYLMSRNTTLLDYEWETTTKNTFHPMISKFTKSMVKKNFTLNIRASSKKDFLQKYNSLISIFEEDIDSVSPGTLIVNGYKLNCYVIAKKISSWYDAANYVACDFTAISEDGKWHMDVQQNFGTGVDIPSDYGLDFPYDFPYDFGLFNIENIFISGSTIPFNFTMTFMGPWENPSVIAGGHLYRVFTTLEPNEYLTIDSYNKTVIKTKKFGEKKNEFHKRDRNNYIFEKIKCSEGRSKVICDKGKNLSITAHLERSEPLWI